MLLLSIWESSTSLCMDYTIVDDYFTKVTDIAIGHIQLFEYQKMKSGI